MKKISRFEFERRKLGLTQQQLADAVGMSRVEICNIENKKAMPRAYNCKKIADFFGVDIIELFDLEVEK
jgi:DNA-binding XRE family transcriptional regulator